jgi:hypothetical protein
MIQIVDCAVAIGIDLAAEPITLGIYFHKKRTITVMELSFQPRFALDELAVSSDKIGFCLFDGFGDAGGNTLYFPPAYTGGGAQTGCGFDNPDGEFVRMGLSPGAADRYASQREFQWIDIAGLRPGGYTLRAIANPTGSIIESGPPNNVVLEPREGGRLPYDVFRELDLGPGGYASVPSTDVKRGVREALKRKLAR